MKDRIYKNFQMYFPSIAADVIEYFYKPPSEIILKTKDGRVRLFNDSSKILYPLPSDPNNLTEEECKQEFGRSLYAVMFRKGMTQDQLAEKTGIAQPSLSRYMSGKVMPSFYIVDKLAKALNCSVDDFRYILPKSE